MDLSLLLVLIAAVGIGWWLGQREYRQKRNSQLGLQADYYKGVWAPQGLEVNSFVRSVCCMF